MVSSTGVKTTDVGLGVSCANNENCVGANSLELVCDPVTVTCSKYLLNELINPLMD